MSDNKLPIIAIVGRPNVGKSSIFNRIVRRRISIVHEQSGVTRDSVVAPARFNNCHFTLVDTGGLGVLLKEKNVDMFDGLIREQVTAVTGEADIFIFVVDCTTGINTLDLEVAKMLHTTGSKVIVAANKADNFGREDVVEAKFAELGFEHVIATSCTHNRGIKDLLYQCITDMPETEFELQNDTLKLAVVGRPNVGKSSMVNQLLGEKRVMVSDIAGTTRDAVDIPFSFDDNGENVPITLIDTAGLRRKRQVDSVVEFFSVIRSEKAIKRADIVLFVLDASSPGTAQDRRIARMIVDERKPCIMIANKWDLYAGKMQKSDLVALFRQAIPFMKYAPIKVISALKGKFISSIFEQLIRLRAQNQMSVPTPVLNRFIQDLIARTPPPSIGGKHLKIYYVTMISTSPVHLLLFVNNKKACAAHYLQYLENQIREAFYREAGIPIILELRPRKSKEGEESTGKRQIMRGVANKQRQQKQRKERQWGRKKGWRKKR